MTPERAPAIVGFKDEKPFVGSVGHRAMRHLGLFEQDNKQGASQVAVLMAEIHGAGARIPVEP